MKIFAALSRAGSCSALALCFWIAAEVSALAVGPPANRCDAERDPLPERASARLGTLRLRAYQETRSVAWSPAGKVIASGHYEGTVRFWNPDTGKLLATPVRHSGDFVRFSQDGSILACAGYGGVIHVLDREGRALFRQKVGGLQYDVALSPDGKWVAVSGEPQGSLLVFDVKAKAIKYRFPAFRYEVGALALSPDGSLLAATGGAPFDAETHVQLWSLKTGTRVGELVGSKRRLMALVFGPGGKTLVSAGLDGVIRVWDVPGRKEVRQISAKALGLALSPDGTRLASYHEASATVRFWDPETGKLVHTLPDCGGGVSAAAFSPDGKTLLTASSRALRLWDIRSGRELRPRPGHTDMVLGLAFSPDGKTLASRGADHYVRLWDVATQKEQHVLPIGESDRRIGPSGPFPPTSVAYAPDGKTLAALGGLVAGERGAPSPDIFLWDSTDPRTRRRFRDSRTPHPLGLAFSPDGKVLATGGGPPQGGVRLWDPSGEVRAILSDPDPEDIGGGRLVNGVVGVAFSPDGRTLAAAGFHRLLLWDWVQRRHLHTLPMKRGPAHLAFSPTGHLVAAAERDSGAPGAVHVWEAASGAPVATLPAPFGEARGIAFSPDGKLLAAGASDEVVRIWDVYGRRHLASWEGHQGDVIAVAFSPDGRTLASGGMDTTILLWDVSGLRPAPPATTSTVKDLAAELSSKDAGKAYAAAWALAGHGDKAVAHLRGTVRAVPKLDPARVARLIEQLNDDDAGRRDEASKELEALGRRAEPALRKALGGKPPAETRRRLSRLLERLGSARGDGAELVAHRALLVLELVGTPAARVLLAELASGEPDAPLTRGAGQALARLRRAAGK